METLDHRTDPSKLWRTIKAIDGKSPPKAENEAITFGDIQVSSPKLARHTLGIICPLYKNKGSVDDPDHYTGITLLSCTCKLFTACLNTRLSNYVDDDILGKEQAGFRKGYSTIDHVFVLHLVIDLYQSVQKRVFCAFIDYQKAFDSVDRSLLWQKLLLYNINGKFLTVIGQMYNRAKSCIKKDNMISEYFLCNIGVRQGDTLSPLLFALFINDFNQYISTTYRGLNIVQSCYPSLNDEDIVLLKTICIIVC